MKTWTVEIWRLNPAENRSHLDRYETIEARTESSAENKAEKTFNNRLAWVRNVRPETDRPLTHKLLWGGCTYGYYTSEAEAAEVQQRMESNGTTGLAVKPIKR